MLLDDGMSYEGGACPLTGEQQDKLKAWISETLPRTTREIGAWIKRECGIKRHWDGILRRFDSKTLALIEIDPGLLT